jgi:hypothetical protein
MTPDLFIKMSLDAWYSKVNEADTLFDSLTDEQLQNEVAPGRNRGVYLLGHSVTVHDRMLPLLGLGERYYKDLDEAFISSPDKAKDSPISIEDLRKSWKHINATLAEGFNSMSLEDWFQRHNSVSQEDFEKEPHRNKLNVLLNRTNHLSYHTGQLVFLKG